MDETSVPSPPATHPLEPLRADEILAAVAAVRETGRITESALFSTVTLDEPSKAAVIAHRPGDKVERRIHLLIVPGPEASVIEAVVALPDGEVVRWTERQGVRPALLFDDSYRATIALREDPDWQKAMARRGITDFDKVQIDPWPTGNFGNPLEEGRRIARCLSYYREEPTDNGYARPVEGVLATVDAARGDRPRGDRPRGGAHARGPRSATGPRTSSPCGTTSARWTSSSPKGSASPSTPTC